VDLTQIVSITLLLISFFLINYLVKKRRVSSPDDIINPLSVVVGTFFALGLGAIFSGFIGIKYSALGLALGIGVVASILHPVAAVSLLISLLIIRPWEFYHNEFLSNILKPAAILAIFSWLVYALKTRRFFIFWGAWMWFFSLFILWLIIAGLCSGDWLAGWNYFFIIFFPIIVVVLLVYNICSDELDLTAIKGTLVISVTGIILTALYVTSQHPELAKFHRLFTDASLFGNANDLAALVTIALPYAFFGLLKKPEGRRRNWIIATFVLTILLYGLYRSQSRGAMLGIGLSVFGYFIFCRKLSTKQIFIMLVFLAASYLTFENVIKSRSDLEDSSTSRWTYVIAGMNMVRSHPFLGVGLGKYADEYEKYTPSFDEYGKRTAHSTWVLVASETGLMGLMLLVFVYGTAFRSAWVVRRTAPEYLVVMLSYGVCMTFLSHTYLILPYMVCALSLVAARVERKKIIKQTVLVISP
jgi:O-antigen ligase